MNLLLLPGMDGMGLLFDPLLESLPDWLHPNVVAYPPNEPLGYAELFPVVRNACPPVGDLVVLGGIVFRAVGSHAGRERATRSSGNHPLHIFYPLSFISAG